MTVRFRPPADELDALLTGAGDDNQVAGVVTRLRELAGAEPVPPMSAELRALVAGQERGDRDDAAVVVPLRRSRRRVAVGAAAIGVVVLGATGAAAANGSLPDPVQDVVADVGDVIGLEIPGPGDRGHAGEDPQPDRGNDGAGHDPQGPKPDSPGSTAPGLTGDLPSETAPGQVGESPASTALGQGSETPASTAPGQGGESPGSTAGPPSDKPAASAPSSTPSSAPGR